MRFSIFVLMVLIAPVAAMAESVVLSPQSLSRVPKGASSANPYWQHLVITLNRSPSAGNSIRINLPVGVAVADTDGDGDLADEVTLDDTSILGTGYNSAIGTSENQIVLQSINGGISGEIHVHYPIETPANPALPSAPYGQISFSNTSETTIPAGTLVLDLVEPHEVQLATFSRLFIDDIADTTTHAQGESYPEIAAPVFDLALPDLVSDVRGILRGAALVSAGVPFADGSDSNDVNYRFWFSTRDSLARVDTSVASVALDRTSLGVAEATEKSLATLAFDVSSLQDTVYYLYMTSNLTGNHPLLRSRGILVQHKPVVLSVGDFKSGDPDFLDSGRLLDFDQGRAGPADSTRSSIDIPFSAFDYNDSASVRLFYATADTLDTTFVTTTGTVPDRVILGLTNATDIDSTAQLLEGRDTQQNWNIVLSDTSFIAPGNYYIYAVITDGSDLGIKRSDHTYQVRHSPFLALDSRQDRHLNTGGIDPDRYYAITWNRDRGKDGDKSLTDNATISLYYSVSDSFAVPGGRESLEGAAADSSQDTHLIVTGLKEDPDARSDNQYIWDLWTHKNPDDQGVPREGVSYHIYGVIEADSTSRIVRWDDEVGQAQRLVFTHEPHLRPLAPMETVTTDGRQSFRVAWQAEDVDQRAGVWVILTEAAGQTLGKRTTYAALTEDAARDWVANSIDGSLAKGTPLSEDLIDEFAVRPSRLIADLEGAQVPMVNGDYVVYLVIDSGETQTPAGSSLAIQVPGSVRISNLGEGGAEGLSSPSLELLPADLAVTVPGDTTLIELRPHSGGMLVDLVTFFASVDTAFFEVVDQDSAPGIQPFKLDSTLTGVTLRDTLLVGADSLSAGRWLLDLIYFEQDDTSHLDGDFTLATMQVVSKDTLGSTTIEIDHQQNRRAAFYRDGEEVAQIPAGTAVRAQFFPRGEISGRLALQGRDTYQNVMTFLLRDRNSFQPITDPLFIATNDADSTQPGIQDSVASDGSFSLDQVPTGNYQLVVHFDGYLNGQFPSIEVNPAEVITGVNPTFLTDGVTDPGYLLGGDVAGYVDTSETQIPDNEIDQLDIDFVVGFFGQTTDPTHPGRLADINGDSLVWVVDLNIVAANFNIDGVEPVYKRVNTADSGLGIWHLKQREEGDELVVEVRADEMAGARAYGYRLRYDPAKLSLRSANSGKAFAQYPAVYAEHREWGEIAMGAALSGDQGVINGDQDLGTFVFALLADTGAEVEIGDAQWVDADHRVRFPRGSAVSPAEFALSPNYPNPFNPQTTVRLHLPERSAIRLEVYDAAGQMVRSLLKGEFEAGVHIVVWDGYDQAGREVATGTYFARLRAGRKIQVRKMTLLR